MPDEACYIAKAIARDRNRSLGRVVGDFILQSSKGAKGASIKTFHLPMEGGAGLLGVDAPLDMARTSVNVLGNCQASPKRGRINRPHQPIVCPAAE